MPSGISKGLVRYAYKGKWPQYAPKLARQQLTIMLELVDKSDTMIEISTHRRLYER
jgi:hypothetical protein